MAQFRQKIFGFSSRKLAFMRIIQKKSKIKDYSLVLIDQLNKLNSVIFFLFVLFIIKQLNLYCFVKYDGVIENRESVDRIYRSNSVKV